MVEQTNQQKQNPEAVETCHLGKGPMCKSLWQKALPHFGMYSFEYEWANLISAYKCNSDFVAPEDGRT